MLCALGSGAIHGIVAWRVGRLDGIIGVDGPGVVYMHHRLHTARREHEGEAKYETSDETTKRHTQPPRRDEPTTKKQVPPAIGNAVLFFVNS
jgi:hypothetical protein